MDGLREPRKSGSRPISRVLSYPPPLRATTETTIPLRAVSPRRFSNLPGRHAGRALCVLRRTPALFGLAPCEVCRAGLLPGSRCALTAPFHPYLILLITPQSKKLLCGEPRSRGHRRYLSVALSVGSRRPAVNWHTALWSPDFPPPALRLAAVVWPTPAGIIAALTQTFLEETHNVPTARPFH